MNWRDQKWRDDAECGRLVAAGELTLEQSDAIFFDNGRPVGAQKICARCPVTEQCRQAAEEGLEAYGVWAGEQGGPRRLRLGINEAGERVGEQAA